MIYDWIFNPLTVRPVEGGMTNVVTMVDWRRTATDGPYLASAFGRVAFPAPQSSAFTPFNLLTKEQVQSWVIEKLVQDSGQQDIVARIDEGLAGDINRQKNPPEVPLAPPWGQ